MTVEDVRRKIEELNLIEGGSFWDQFIYGAFRAREETQKFGEVMIEIGRNINEKFSTDIVSGLFDVVEGSKTAAEAAQDFFRGITRWVGELILKNLILRGLNKLMGVEKVAAGAAEIASIQAILAAKLGAMASEGVGVAALTTLYWALFAAKTAAGMAGASGGEAAGLNAGNVGTAIPYQTGGSASFFSKFRKQMGLITKGSGKRDDVPAMLGKHEFVMRESAVRKYGTSFMNAVNKGMLNMMGGGLIPAMAGDVRSFQGGGSASGEGGADLGQEPPVIKIFNITDARLIDKYIATVDGKNALMNFIGAEAQSIRNILRG
jgi:hypothetical protein